MTGIWDQHIHSKFSGDSTTAMDEMAREAIQKNLMGITFTDHHDIDFPVKEGEPAFLLDFNRYLIETENVRRRYEGALHIRTGVELGLQLETAEKNLKVLKNYQFDFVLGSVHVLYGKDPFSDHVFIGKKEDQVFQDYFETIYRNITKFPLFDSLGHMDYIVRYAPKKDKKYNPKKHKIIIDKILKFLISKNIGIEINTSGLKTMSMTLPHPYILQRYKVLGGKIVTIGSDAHDTKFVGYELESARKILKGIGFTHYAVFDKRKPSLVKL